ncbi:MAG TPA: GYF domain-containing protein [Flavobacterium sp.]|nr:GYF domain-containing protein [Flavobacterium sp.]
MKKYYLHNGIESSGPFDLAELQMKQITATTPVWFSGMPDWKTAAEIDELQTILKVVPPPFKSVPPAPKREEKNPKIMGLNKIAFYSIFLFVLLIIGSFVLTILEENRKVELEQKNFKTEKENRQFQLQEKEIQQQKQQLVEQEKLESERITKERKAAINTKLSENQIKKIEYQTHLEEAKNKLVKATDFQFFRTPEEKNREINAIQADITYFNNEIQLLENERNQLALELEKMQYKAHQIP